MNKNMIENMKFTISETTDGYKYKDKNYKWGDGIIELVNSDFSDFLNLIDNMIVYYDNQITNCNFPIDIPVTEVTNLYTPIFHYNSKFLHINLLQSYLRENFTKYDPIDMIGPPDDPIPTIDFYSIRYDWSYHIAMNLKFNKRKYQSILKDYSKYKTNYLSQDSISSLNEYVTQPSMSFPYMEKKIKEIKQNGKIEYVTTFYTIEEFCKYEFFKILDNNINIRYCPNCNKYFINKHGNEKYCSKKCRKHFNKEIANHNPYTKEYTKKYKDIYNYYSYYSLYNKIQDKTFKELTQPLRKIYDEKKQPLNDKINEIKLNQFIEELNLEFNKIMSQLKTINTNKK